MLGIISSGVDSVFMFLPGPHSVYQQGCCYGNGQEHPSSSLRSTSEETLGLNLKHRQI